ncbi:glycosyl hydrolase family 61 [Colletotrichum karsti]|uniref:lytic cellulose monooxygenase (C4-dehydrogenating) n=1 Tax=Colletotrichum karsti TaxID=1095194 RepID=A0A9P6LG47_9PEZI|nr:glycosyl hydrolase family 61 [Colletotrichum karsti]KAF9871052.1 glycosyl hydrolase family 61 [Colletotrichum karsti]
MRTFSFLAAAALVSQATAHYVFPTLIVNGEQTERYEFVREAKNSNSPVEDVTSEGIVCNKGGNDDDVLAKTKTKAVNAGDEVGFIVENDMGHPGPLAVYMSKAPDSVSSYKGDGDWFKIYELTTSDITDAGLQWATYVNNAGIHNFTFSIPKEVPTGEYLLRAEHVGLHGAGSKGGAQFYIACAQLSVTGASSGTPEPTVKFPGAYTGEEPGLLINIYYPAPKNYTAPGPSVWPDAACIDHTANLLGQTSDGDCTGSDGTGATPTTPSTPTASAGIPDYNGGNSTTTPTEAAQPSQAAAGDDCENSAARRRARSMRRRLARAAY